MPRSPSSSRSRQRTRGWRRAKTKACCSRRPTSAFARQPRTRRRARPPSSKSARPSSKGDEIRSSRRFGRYPMASDNLFSGLKVVDFASFIAGPSAAVILSDFGAEVIKVEPPKGELWRIGQKIPPQPYSEEPYPFQLANRNKRSLTLDLKSPEAGKILEQLVKWADVFIVNTPH